jgi:N-acetylmuramoyl-L-alanine amidase
LCSNNLSVTADLESTLYALHGNTARASVHYLIDKEIDDNTESARQYQEHNDLTQQAFYAGKSYWKNEAHVNNFGIGIMLINDANSEFLPKQIGQLKLLLRDIHSRYPKLDVKTNIVSFGEVAYDDPDNIAPGKKFPWKDLADDGFGRWVETTEAQQTHILISESQERICISGVQRALQLHGYHIDESGHWDTSTAVWFAKFNIRYGTSYRDNHSSESIEDKDKVWTQASQHVLHHLNNTMEMLDSELIADTVESTADLH